MSDEHSTVDGTLIQARASLRKFEHLFVVLKIKNGTDFGTREPGLLPCRSCRFTTSASADRRTQHLPVARPCCRICCRRIWPPEGLQLCTGVARNPQHLSLEITEARTLRQDMPLVAFQPLLLIGLSRLDSAACVQSTNVTSLRETSCEIVRTEPAHGRVSIIVVTASVAM